MNVLADDRNHKLKPLFDKIRIEESHQFCLSSGLDKESVWPTQCLSGDDLDTFLIANSALNAFSQQLFADISRDFTDGNDLFILSDANARLIHQYSSPDVLKIAKENIGLRSGVLLSESSCGTNAIALALRYLEPMITSRAQHYCRLLQNWGAVALPVLNANLQPVACVAILHCSDYALGEKLLIAKFMVKELEKFFKGQASVPAISSRAGSTHAIPAKAAVGLTTRQQQVLRLFATGMSYKQIAREIGINSFKTVEEHLDAVREKLQVAHRRECIHKAISLGLI